MYASTDLHTKKKRYKVLNNWNLLNNYLYCTFVHIYLKYCTVILKYSNTAHMLHKIDAHIVKKKIGILLIVFSVYVCFCRGFAVPARSPFLKACSLCPPWTETCTPLARSQALSNGLSKKVRGEEQARVYSTSLSSFCLIAIFSRLIVFIQVTFAKMKCFCGLLLRKQWDLGAVYDPHWSDFCPFFLFIFNIFHEGCSETEINWRIQ